MQNNRFKFFGLLVLIGLFSQSCKKDTVELEENCEDSYILFGHFYGECIGEGCIEIFKLCENMLYEDTVDKYPSSLDDSYPGSFQQIVDNVLFTEVENLITQIPDNLFSETDKILGQPDAGDWGGYYIEVKKEGGDPQFWLIDTMKDNIPAYLRDYTDNVQAAIELINE
jgi:hypothetical protein